MTPPRPWIYCVRCWEAIAGWEEWDEHEAGGCRGYPLDGREGRGRGGS